MYGNMRTTAGVPRPTCYAAGRSEDIDGDYEEKISAEILSWPDMINN
jgi:hypothetical protein